MTSNRTSVVMLGMTKRELLTRISQFTLMAGAASLMGSRAFAQDSYQSPPADGPRLSLRVATNYAGNASAARPLNAVFDKFRADYPNISLSHEATPGYDHETKIKLDATSNRLPDVFSFWRMDPSFGLNQIADAGLLADLTEWTAADPFFENLFDESSWNTATRNGVVYGVPAQVFYIWFVANKAVFDRAGVAIPSTWDELVAAGRALKAAGELPWAINTGSDSMGARVYNYVMNRQLGNERAIAIHSGAEQADNPDMLRAVTLVRDLLTGNTPSDGISMANDMPYAKYINVDRGAMFMDGSFRLQSIDPAVADNMVVMDFPLIPDGAQAELSVERDLTSLWYSSARSWADEEKRPYVQELIRRVSSRESALRLTEDAKIPMAQQDIGANPEILGRLAVETSERAFAVPGNRWVPRLMTPEQRSRFEPLMSELIEGKHTPEQYVAQFSAIFS
jgi:raffinose/stachyose/melibiose transport system substrate-binding protein